MRFTGLLMVYDAIKRNKTDNMKVVLSTFSINSIMAPLDIP